MMSCDAMSLHMERMVCWPVGTGVQDCPAGLAWAHEAWALSRGRPRVLGQIQMQSASSGLSGKWREMAGRPATAIWRAGWHFGNGCSMHLRQKQTRARRGSAPLPDLIFNTTFFFFPPSPPAFFIDPLALLSASGEERKHSKKPLFGFLSPPFLPCSSFWVSHSHPLNLAAFFSFSSDQGQPCCTFNLTKHSTQLLSFRSLLFFYSHNSPDIITG